MAEVKWIKITTDMFDNSKIKFIRTLPEGSDILLVWIMTLVKAGKCNSSGFIFLTENIPYDFEMLSAEFNIPINTIKLAFNTFEKLDMTSTNEKGYIFVNGWNEHQNAESLDSIREYNRLAKQKSREKQKLLCQSNVIDNIKDSQGKSQGSQETDIDIDIDIDIDNNIYTCWNENKIIIHKKLTNDMKKAIKKTLKDYSQDEINQSIKNYSQILKDDKYFFNYKWRLEEFLVRGLKKFLDWDVCSNNFLTNKTENNYSKKQSKPNNDPKGRDYSKETISDLEKKLLGWDQEEG